MNKTSLNPAIYQTFLDSLAPAASIPQATALGQAQFFTPTAWATALAAALPRSHSILCDFTCGAGHLLRACGDRNTHAFLGCEIDPEALSKFPQTSQAHPHALRYVAAGDLTQFAPLLHHVRFRANLFVLNPPWNLPWRADRFRFLESSDVPTVRASYQSAIRNPQSAIDSTLATLLLALHFSADNAEGFLIANTATLDRLILESASPAHALLPHFWAHLIFPGNPCTDPIRKSAIRGPSGSVPHSAIRNRWGAAMRTSVLFFSRQTPSRPSLATATFTAPAVWPDCQDWLTATAGKLGPAGDARRAAGLALNLQAPFQFEHESINLWNACAEELSRPSDTPQYNLWLDSRGLIRTHLSLYQQRSSRLLAEQMAALHSLNGKTPIALVTQRAERDLLLKHTGVSDPARPPVHSPIAWKVDPKLQEVVHQVVLEYHAGRAPLVPLPKNQRLGFLEEEDSILCELDLSLPSVKRPLFRAGQRYSLRTQSVAVKRIAERYNPIRDCEELIEYTGAELATFLTDSTGVERCFMEGRLAAPATAPGNSAAKILIAPRLGPGGEYESTIKIDFTLEHLATHFHIPEIPDIAVLQPALYQRHMDALTELDGILCA